MTYKLQPFLSSEEQISAMRKELEKYGIQMPAFSKIGGILESEVCISIKSRDKYKGYQAEMCRDSPKYLVCIER